MSEYIQIGDSLRDFKLDFKHTTDLSSIPASNFNLHLANLGNTTIKCTGTLTEEGMRIFKPMFESPLHISICAVGLDDTLKQLRRIRASLSSLEKLASRTKRRNHQEKLRTRRKHRAMFRRKKRGLA